MEIHICRDGEKFGPYPRALTHFYLREGMLSADDLCWHKGLAEWRPLGEALPPPVVSNHRSLRMSPMTRPIPAASRIAALSTVQARAASAIPGRAALKPVAASAPVQSKQRRGSSHWIDYVMNGAIALLIVCAAFVYLTRGAGQEISQSWRTRVAMLGHSFSESR